MKPFLFPNRLKRIGWFITIPSIIIGIVYFFSGTELNASWLDVTVPRWLVITDGFLGTRTGSTVTLNLTDELLTIALTVGLMLIAFSKEKIEDEFIAKTRLESLQWGVCLNTLLLIIGTLLFYDGYYFNVMIFNMFTPLIFFVIRFNYIIYLKPRFDKTSERIAA